MGSYPLTSTGLPIGVIGTRLGGPHVKMTFELIDHKVWVLVMLNTKYACSTPILSVFLILFLCAMDLILHLYSRVKVE